MQYAFQRSHNPDRAESIQTTKIRSQIELKETDRDNPDEEESVEGENDEHGYLHHPEVAGFILHEEAGGGLIQNIS